MIKYPKLKSNTIAMRNYICLFIILLIAISLRSYCFIGMIGSDDLRYNFEALSILEGTFTLQDSNSGRIGLVFPMAFFLKIFGLNEISLILFNYLCSLGSVILAYFFGKMIFGEKTGLIAALLMAVLPVDVIFSTQALPDFPMALFAGLSVFLFLLSEKAKNIKRKFILFTLCGFSLSVAYTIKEPVFYIGILLLVYSCYKVFIKKNSIRLYLFVVLGFLIIFIPETLCYYVDTGDILFRFKRVESWLGHLFVGGLHMLAKRLFFDFWELILFSFSMFGFLFWFVIIAMIYMLKRKLYESYKIIYWIAGLFILYNFGSCSLTSYKLIVFSWKDLAVYKYSALFILPTVLIVAYFFKNILDNKVIRFQQKCAFFNSKFSRYFVFCFFLMSTIYFLMTSHFSNNYPYPIFSSRNERIISRFLCDKENGLKSNRIYTDPRTKLVLPCFLYHQSSFLINSYYKPVDEMMNSYIILNWPRINFLSKYRNEHPPEFVYDIPDDWVVVKKIKNKKVEDLAIMYFIPRKQ